MTEDNPTEPEATPAAPRWCPLSAMDRRVLGVLAEKAKTTPDAYPMTLNAIVTGCNQKSNRAPIMQLEPEDVQESLDHLRELGALGMVEGYGRVSKFRHYLYDWLGVDKVELSVMTELLLRGAQTEGDLRTRVSRMDPISDLTALRELLVSLKAKRLVVPLTPEGRGHVVTHGLHQPRELEHLKAHYSQVGASVLGGPEESTQSAAIAGRPSPSPAREMPAVGELPAVEALRRELGELRSQFHQLRKDLEEISLEQQQMTESLRELKDSLGG